MLYLSVVVDCVWPRAPTHGTGPMASNGALRSADHDGTTRPGCALLKVVRTAAGFCTQVTLVCN